MRHYLGGSGIDGARDIAVDDKGNAYVVGITKSPDFPAKMPVQGFLLTDSRYWNSFLTAISPAGDLLYSTYLGGPTAEAYSIALRGSTAFVAGAVRSDSLSTLLPAQASFGGGAADAFVIRLRTDAAIQSALKPDTGSLQLRYVLGNAASSINASVSITSDSGPVSFRTETDVHAPWLKATPSGATTPTSVLITASAEGLPTGSYTSSVSLISPLNVRLEIPVTLNVFNLLPPSLRSSRQPFRCTHRIDL